MFPVLHEHKRDRLNQQGSRCSTSCPDESLIRNVAVRGAVAPLDDNSCASSSVSLLSEDILANSSHPPSYREVLEHPDNYIISSFHKRKSISEVPVATGDDFLHQRTFDRSQLSPDKALRPVTSLDETEDDDARLISPNQSECPQECGDEHFHIYCDSSLNLFQQRSTEQVIHSQEHLQESSIPNISLQQPRVPCQSSQANGRQEECTSTAPPRFKDTNAEDI